MMETVRTWIMSVVAVGMLVSLCLGLSPGGKVQKVARFCGGLLLFLAVVTPLLQWDFGGSLQKFEDYCSQLSTTSEDFTQASGTLTQDLVASQSEACIEAQANTLGMTVAVTVTCETKDGLSIPADVLISGDLTPQQQQTLTRWIMDAFDLTQEQVRAETEKAEGSQ